ncbi:MAG: EAL domain-containing protein, partial [Janthinobacterium lividum]
REPFALALQPIFEGASGRLAGFEALVRWPQPDGHVLPPSEFIPVAEATGLVVQLDRWVLDQACRLASTWPEHIRISSNLSAANFYAVGLVREVERTLVRHGLAPDRLKLEITETVLLRDPDRVRRMIADLRRLGVHVVLDDFGSGHASLAYLRDYAFDGLKIDSSFTAEIESGTKGRAFLRAIIDMAEAMGIDTTAEGVETDGQLRQLCEGNVRFIQGFLLGRPMTPDAAMALVRAQHDPEHPQWAAAD